MAEQVEEKAVELMDKAADAIEAFAGKLEALGVEYGPDVVDAALGVARVSAASEIVTGFVLTACGAVGLRFGWPLASNGIKLARRYMKPDYPVNGPDGFALAAVGSVGCVISCIVLMIGLLELIDVWPWVGIFEPKLWIAKQVLGL